MAEKHEMNLQDEIARVQNGSTKPSDPRTPEEVNRRIAEMLLANLKEAAKKVTAYN